MGLAVTEKEHWKSRVERRLNQASEALSASNQDVLAAIAEQAERKALESLKIDALKDNDAELERKITALELEQKELQQEKKRLAYAMLATIRKCKESSVQDLSQWKCESEVSQVIKQVRNMRERELLAESTPGRRILELKREKEELLDTVWLATSSREMKELWQTTVSDVLGQDSTPLQTKALAILPNDPST